MKIIPRPGKGNPIVFDDCVATVTLDRRGRLDTARESVLRVDAEYVSSVNKGTAHEFVGPTFKPELKTDLKWLYERKLRDERRSDHVYDDLLLLAGADCPYCGLDSPKQLDHCLPKSKYPHLSVTPLNLVPMCIACNFLKSDAIGASLNAYFDVWAAETTWLKADMPDPSQPGSLEFTVEKVSGWSSAQQQAVEASFISCDLATRYADRALIRWGQFAEEYAGIFDEGGETELSRHLIGNVARHMAHRMNGWEAATYRCWLLNVRRARWDA